MTKKIFFSLFSIVLIGAFLFSCQTEDSEFIDEIGEGTITSQSSIAGLILNISQNNITIDDFIDMSNCSSIQFPYQVIVNGQTITVNNEADVVALSNANSPIEIVFPITIVFADYSTFPIANQNELNDVIAQCPGINDSINCVGLMYPITFYSFNSTNELLTTILINSDAQMFAFLSGLGNDDYVSIEYPILIVYGNGDILTAATDQQLEDFILNCEEEIITPPNPLEGFENILTTDEWYVSLHVNDGTDETDLSEMYEIIFNSDGTATAINGGDTINATWSASATGPGNNDIKLDLYFGSDDPFDEWDQNWNVVNFNNNLIRLEKVDDKLTFSREQNDIGGTGGNEIQQLKSILSIGDWKIENVEINEDNMTADYSSYIFTFNQSNDVFATNTAGTVEGHWNANNNGGSLKMTLDFDPYPLDQINNNWNVDLKEATRVELSKGDDVLVFEKE